jgi:tRNA-dihydrouridine synthase B
VRIGSHEVQPGTVLAPMAAITNPPFRQVCLEAGVGLTVTEMLSADQVCREAEVPVERCEAERVLVVQIFGRSPVIMARAARAVVDRGADVVDINMGCPAKKVVFQGAGVCLMREPDLAALVVESVARAVEAPVTVKMRAGFAEGEQNAPEIARRVVAAGAAAVTVHARVRTAVHTGKPDWDVIARVRDALPPGVPVIGNGGITTPEQGLAMGRQTGCDAVMVGRGARGNPWIFDELRRGETLRPDRAELVRVIRRHLELYVDWGGEGRAVREMRKHLCWYFRGLPGASKLRARLGGLGTREQVLALVDEVA